MQNSFDSYVGHFKWINHQDKEILHLEFRGGYESDARHYLALFIQEISGRQERSVLLLASLSDAAYSPALAMEWQKHQHLLHSRCSKVVVHGAKGVISHAVNAFLNLARLAGLEIGSKIRSFEDINLAKDWLVQEIEN